MNSQTNVDLVLVYLGNQMPKYVEKNLEYLRSNFPEHRIIFIGDSERTLSKARKLQVEVFKTVNWQEMQREVYLKLKHPREFRSGFWFKTIARFFAIAEFQAVSLRPLIQIECDVLVAGNFPFAAFSCLIDSVAFPMENLSQGAASILWIGNSKLSQELAEISLKLIHNDPQLTDMTILGKVANELLIPYVSLPTIRSSEDFIQSVETEKFFKNFNYFGGCFDALAYGMFLLGSDPRNRRGLSELFKKRPEQVMPRNVSSIRSNDKGTAIEVQLESGTSYKLFCLHNHSKNLKVWSTSRHEFINRRSRMLGNGKNQTHVFYPVVFLRLLLSKVKRTIKVGNK